MFHLFEANLANAADTTISITNAAGEEIEMLNSFNKIFDTFMKKLVKPRNPNPDVLTWFTSNFKNWLKNGGLGYDDHGKYMSASSFHQLIYPDFKDVVASLVEEFPEMSSAEIIKAFPEYIQRATNSVEIFAGGRLFRLNKLSNLISELIDYLNATTNADRNPVLLPDAYFVKQIGKLTPVEAMKKSVEYHEYTKRMGEKISREQIIAEFKSLTPGDDYIVHSKLGNNLQILQAKTAKFAGVEGRAMKHCVGTYGKNIENGTVVILSLNDGGVPRATFELPRNSKTIQQLKGPHNSLVQPEYHEALKKFIVDNDMKFGSNSDWRNIGLKSANELDKKRDKADVGEAFFNDFLSMLTEADDDKKKKLKTKTKTKPDVSDIFNIPLDGGNLPAKHDAPELSKANLDLKRAGADQTHRKMKDVKMSFTSFLQFLNMDLTGLEDKIDAATDSVDLLKPTPSLLPTVINTALIAAGMVQPEWHMVRNLPGYLSAGIRAIGRQVFAPFTSTRIEDIQVIANLNNSGPNSSIEINSVVKFLKDHGTRNSQAEIKFTERIPGYEASLLVYTFANYSFLLVKDHAGQYIYSWPSVDNKTALKDASLDQIRLN